MSESAHFPALLSSSSGVAGFPDLPGTALSEVSLPPPVAEDTETRAPVRIAEADRCGGVYVLGRPRTGKSTLLISLALADINRGHGILFIDPHTDAINDLIARIPESRLQDVILLDPTDKTRSFGINLLCCDNHNDPIEIDKTYGRVKNIFAKVWGGEKGQLGVWLDKVLRNSVYLLLENPGYTIVDIPLLVEEDTRFRDFLLENVKVKPYVRDFWFKEFDRLSRRDRTEQIGPVLSRLDVFRNTTIRHFVGQARSTIDFHDIINGTGRPKIILLRMPGHFYDDEQEIIGTVLLGEVIQAVYARDKLPIERRRYFGIFCDEFQNFATPDFAKLFTETGKFNVMPVVAHHERVGQFSARDENRGATGAAPNKIFFSLTPADAEEVAAEFAKEPPEEIRRERELVIFQEPLSELMRGHRNPEVRDFVNKYLRTLRYRREDVTEEMEGGRLRRMHYLDRAGMYGLEEQMERLESRDYYIQLRHLDRKGRELAAAQAEGIKLLQLFDEARKLRLTQRALNDFLVAIMEGRVRQGQEAFSNFLIQLIGNIASVPEQYIQALGLYIVLSYGDPDKHRIIPFDLAELVSQFSQEVAMLTLQAKKKTEEERQAFQAKFIAEEEEKRAARRRDKREKEIRDRQKEMESSIHSIIWRHNTTDRSIYTRRPFKDCKETELWYPANVYTWFVWLSSYRNIEKLILPYRTAKFGQFWKMSEKELAETIDKITQGLTWKQTYGIGSEKYMEYMRPKVAGYLKEFLYRYQEGALVMIALLDCAGRGGPRFNMFSGMEGKDPVEIWCLLEKLRCFMYEEISGRRFSSLFVKYFERGDYLNAYTSSAYDELLGDAGFAPSISRTPIYDYIKKREDVQLLEKLRTKGWNWFAMRCPVAKNWSKIDTPVRYYLLARAADLVTFEDGDESLPPSTFAPYEELAKALANVMIVLNKDKEARLAEAEERQEAPLERKRIEAECAEKVAKIFFSPPVILSPRALSGNEIQEIKKYVLNN